MFSVNSTIICSNSFGSELAIVEKTKVGRSHLPGTLKKQSSIYCE